MRQADLCSERIRASSSHNKAEFCGGEFAFNDYPHRVPAPGHLQKRIFPGRLPSYGSSNPPLTAGSQRTLACSGVFHDRSCAPTGRNQLCEWLSWRSRRQISLRNGFLAGDLQPSTAASFQADESIE